MKRTIFFSGRMYKMYGILDGMTFTVILHCCVNIDFMTGEDKTKLYIGR